MFDTAAYRKEFPILERKVSGYPLVYLDNTATTQTPRQVVEAIDRMYYHTKANVHRGVHTLSGGYRPTGGNPREGKGVYQRCFDR